METRKIVSLPAELAQAIEDYRFTNRLKTEAEAIRQLIEAGLSVRTRSPPAGGSNPGGASKPSTAPAQRKPGRQTEPAQRQSKEAQIRALREQG
jgi:hypothetical protein